MLDLTDEQQTKLFPIILKEYNPAWPEWFAEEKARLLKHIGSQNVIRISHIGSTSVPGLLAKPTVDILLEISESTDIDVLCATLPQNEYICLRQQTLDTRDQVVIYKGYTDLTPKLMPLSSRVFHLFPKIRQVINLPKNYAV